MPPDTDVFSVDENHQRFKRFLQKGNFYNWYVDI